MPTCGPAKFEAAVDAVLPVIHDDTPFTAEMMLPELIEAAVGAELLRGVTAPLEFVTSDWPRYLAGRVGAGCRAGRAACDPGG